jgi:serine/threonine protein kinase
MALIQSAADPDLLHWSSWACHCGLPSKGSCVREDLSMKPIHHGQKRTVLREIETYRKIRKLLQETGGHLQTPRLHGLVQEENGSQIVALLLTWIDCRRATNLECIANPRNDTPLSLRLKWMGQIESTLEVLHQAGIVWGDVKAANVLIDDVNQDAWIIDFGGGYTVGWVDRDRANTIEGDLQGLSKIRQYLRVG